MRTDFHPRRAAAPVVIAVVAVMAIAAALLYVQATHLAAADAHARLQTSRVAQRVIEEHSRDNLRLRAQLITGDQAFVGYVSQALGGALPGVPIDTPSIVDLLVERRDQLGLAVAAVLDGQGRLVVATERISDHKELGTEPLFLRAHAAHAIATGLWNDGERLWNVAILPLARDGSSDAYLLVGMPVDHAMASAIAEVAGTQVALLARTSAGPLVVASTLDPAAESALRAAMPATSAPTSVTRLLLNGQAYPAAVVPLLGSKVAQLVVLVPPKGAAATALALLWPTLLGVALLVALILVAALWWWWRIVKPTRVLAELLARAAGGDHHLHVDESGAGALGPLATGFNRLMERLSAPPR